MKCVLPKRPRISSRTQSFCAIHKAKRICKSSNKITGTIRSSQELLLSLYEGKAIEFETDLGWGQKKVVQGKIIRSGYVPHSQSAMQRYGQAYYQSQMAMATGTAQPIIEVDGKLQFSLPGKPVFPALTDDTILKPDNRPGS